jgi:hypothetical protein
MDGVRPWLTQRQAAEAQQAADDAARATRDQQGQRPQSGKPPPAAALVEPWRAPLTDGPDAVWEAFVARARDNLHWVLAMSPGDAFGDRWAHMFSSGCCDCDGTPCTRFVWCLGGYCMACQ